MSSATSGRVRAVALAFVLVLAVPSLVGVAAADERVGGTVVVEEGETVTDGLQATGGTVVVRGTVEGNLQAFAGTLVVAESGTVTGNVEGAAGSVTIAGAVGGDVEVAGGSVSIEETATIAGDVESGAGSFVLDGRVNGSVQVGASSITLGDSAVVEGDFVYDGELTRAEGATVGGELREDPGLSVPGVPGLPQVASWLFTAYSLLVTLVFGAILLLVLPGVANTAAEGTQHTPLRTAGAGLLTLFGGPLLFVVLLFTIVGIPLAILWLLLWVLLLLAGFVLGEYAVGAWLLSLADRENRWLALLVGVVVVYLVGLVPLLGGLVEFVVLLLGVGAFTLAAYNWGKGRRRGNGEDELDDDTGDDGGGGNGDGGDGDEATFAA